MRGWKAKARVGILIAMTLGIGLLGMYGLLKPIINGCVMTYMYPTYIPVSKSGPSSKYGLYLYHEGWRKIDFQDHLKRLCGVPVLFIPGNGGSYKQVRSLAAESDRAYLQGPLEKTFYREASLTPDEGGTNEEVAGFQLPHQYTSRLDWFAVDLEGEHSAMDGRILEEHTEYVVYAIHRILDRYKESRDSREREGAAPSNSLPKSVILVGHSMGGFVARAAIIHPHLRKAAVETIVTLSTPHQSPPVALQPSLGHYFTRVNEEWKRGYMVQTTPPGHYKSEPLLSHVVVVSISGGYNDYQVRTKLEALDGIVPPTHGFMMSSTGMKNVWLSMEHQAILWCNQLVVQVSHTILSLIDSRTGQPVSDTGKRLAVFARMLRSGIPQSFNWMGQSYPSRLSANVQIKDVEEASGFMVRNSSACPNNIHWNDDGLERDLYIHTTTLTVLAMDGKRRWLDIQKLGSNGKSHFMFVTNLSPCSGVRLHLWPEKGQTTSDIAASKRVVEVTLKLVQIPSRPSPRQIEPGSQTEQAPPSAVIWLSPDEMRGFRFLSVSVAPRPTISGRPPPAASMAVGQFFNPEDGQRDFSVSSMLASMYSGKEVLLGEDHPLVFNLSFAISLGLQPVSLSLETRGCGIKRTAADEFGDEENRRLCKLRCFPPVAFAWDPMSGLHVFPNLYHETIIVDSSPAIHSSVRGYEKTTILLLVDPHCSYKMGIAVSKTSAASRFLLLYGSQIVGLSMAVIFFALMRQAHAWDLDLPIPSVLVALEMNMGATFPILLLGVTPIVVSLFASFMKSQPLPSLGNFITVSFICYLFANGSVMLLVLVSQSTFYAAAIMHVFVKTRWLNLEESFCFGFLHWFINLSSNFFSLKVMRVLRVRPLLVIALTAITLGGFIHPALGLSILLLSHAFCCHSSLCSVLTASFHSHVREKELLDCKDETKESSLQFALKREQDFSGDISLEENNSNSPNSSKSIRETQLEVFNHRHGLLILHFLAVLMFFPSFVAWLQRIGMGHSFPWFLDSALCTGVIMHGTFNSKPEFNSLFTFPSIMGREIRLDMLYLLAGFYCYLSGLYLEPYRVFYAMAVMGFLSLALRILHHRSRERGDPRFGRKKHSHRH